MDIFIDDKAQEYIKLKTEDNTIQVLMTQVGSGWCVSYQPSVRMGKPVDEKTFGLFKTGEFNVYVLNGVKLSENGIKITLSKFLWMKTLNVEGLIA